MKKFIALLLTLVMCFALAATASAESPAEPEYTEITMKLSHHNAVDQPIGVALDAWAKKKLPLMYIRRHPSTVPATLRIPSLWELWTCAWATPLC